MSLSTTSDIIVVLVKPITPETRFYFPEFYLLGGRGEASPQTSQIPPLKSFPEKNLKLFQTKIFSDDDFKESVKVTNVQKCDFSQS